VGEGHLFYRVLRLEEVLMKKGEWFRIREYHRRSPAYGGGTQTDRTRALNRNGFLGRKKLDAPAPENEKKGNDMPKPLPEGGKRSDRAFSASEGGRLLSERKNKFEKAGSMLRFLFSKEGKEGHRFWGESTIALTKGSAILLLEDKVERFVFFLAGRR